MAPYKNEHSPPHFIVNVWRGADKGLLQNLGFNTAFVILACWNTLYVWNMATRFHMNDFGKFYYSVVAFLNDQNMYGPNPATFIQISDYYSQHFWNLNPPHFHLFLLPLGFLSPIPALLLWSVASFIAFCIGLYWISHELKIEMTLWQKRLVPIGFLAFAGTGAHFITGQLSFFLFLLVTGAWVQARQGKWGKAGWYLGMAISIKPFFLIFIPYLLQKRRFRAIRNICILLLTTIVIGIGVFGIDTYTDWIQRLIGVDWAWPPMNASLLGLLARSLVENPSFAIMINAEAFSLLLWIFISLFLGGMTFFVTVHDSSPFSVDRAFAILLITAVLVSPLGWIYYLFLPIGPMTALVVNWWQQQGQKSSPHSMIHLRFRNILLFAALPGFLIPLPLMTLFQPNALATLTIGSAYFWSTFLIWMSLLTDCRLESHLVRRLDP